MWFTCFFFSFYFNFYWWLWPIFLLSLQFFFLFSWFLFYFICIATNTFYFSLKNGLFGFPFGNFFFFAIFGVWFYFYKSLLVCIQMHFLYGSRNLSHTLLFIQNNVQALVKAKKNKKKNGKKTVHRKVCTIKWLLLRYALIPLTHVNLVFFLLLWRFIVGVALHCTALKLPFTQLCRIFFNTHRSISHHPIYYT